MNNEHQLCSKLRALIQELIDEELTNNRADNGVHCVFCYAEVSYYPSKTCKHDRCCWLIRANEVLKSIEY